MSPGALALRARILLALWVGVCAGLLWFLDLPARISTDVLDLIPVGERRPELTMVRGMAAERQGRVVLLALDPPAGLSAGRRAALGEAVQAALGASGAFEELQAMGGTATRDALGKAVHQGRMNLLFPGWLARQRAAWLAEGGAAGGPDADWLAARAVRELETFVGRPEAVAFQDLLPSDPLLLLPGLVDKLQEAQLQSGGTEGAVLFWGLMRGNPMNEADQARLGEAVRRASDLAFSLEAGSGLRWTAVARFAELSRARIQSEMTRLNLLSLVAVFGMAALCLSRVFRSLHLVPPVLISTLTGWCVTLLVFTHVHVLVFVVGSLLAGVAVDYGFYLFMQPPAYPEEPYTRRAGRLLRPLMASALTTILGFSLLLFSELPLIRQLGVFVSVGLLAALGAALLWFAQVRNAHLPARPFAAATVPAGPVGRWVAWGLIFACVLAACVGPWRLEWRDDIRTLEVPSPELRENDAALRRLFGEEPGRALYLSVGADAIQAREAWGRLEAWHAERHPDQGLLSLALLLPSRSEWAGLSAASPVLEGFPGSLGRELEAGGFEVAGFEPFFREWARWRSEPQPSPDSLAAGFQTQLRGPVALLMSVRDGQAWFASVSGAPFSPGDQVPEGSFPASQLATLNRLFSDYRQSALLLSSIGLSLVGLSVFVLYGLRRGLVVFMIPSGACLGAFGILGLCGQTLNLFHLLGAFLGVCLSHNYAIFSIENRLGGKGVPPSIRMSALSTFASFAVLGLSSIPVVAALGTIVALIVLLALLFVEIGAILSRPRTGAACATGAGDLNQASDDFRPHQHGFARPARQPQPLRPALPGLSVVDGLPGIRTAGGGPHAPLLGCQDGHGDARAGGAALQAGHNRGVGAQRGQCPEPQPQELHP